MAYQYKLNAHTTAADMVRSQQTNQYESQQRIEAKAYGGSPPQAPQQQMVPYEESPMPGAGQGQIMVQGAPRLNPNLGSCPQVEFTDDDGNPVSEIALTSDTGGLGEYNERANFCEDHTTADLVITKKKGQGLGIELQVLDDYYVVTHIKNGSPCVNVLETGDVLLAVDGVTVSAANGSDHIKSTLKDAKKQAPEVVVHVERARLVTNLLVNVRGGEKLGCDIEHQMIVSVDPESAAAKSGMVTGGTVVTISGNLAPERDEDVLKQLAAPGTKTVGVLSPTLGSDSLIQLPPARERVGTIMALVSTLETGNHASFRLQKKKGESLKIDVLPMGLHSVLPGVFIANIRRGSCCEGHLSPGHQIMQCNGQSMTGISYEAACKIIKQASKQDGCSMEVLLHGNLVNVVEFERADADPAIHVDSGLVCAVDVGSDAERAGVKVGQAVYMINNVIVLSGKPAERDKNIRKLLRKNKKLVLKLLN